MAKLRQHVVFKPIDLHLIKSNISNDILDKLFANVRFDVNDKGCWVRGNDSTIYTTLTIDGKQIKAHRLSFELFNGRQPYLNGCHSCDVPACINPGHILDRSTSWNNRDAMSKDRLGQAQLGWNDRLPDTGIDYYKNTAPGFIERI